MATLTKETAENSLESPPQAGSKTLAAIMLALLALIAAACSQAPVETSQDATVAEVAEVAKPEAQDQPESEPADESEGAAEDAPEDVSSAPSTLPEGWDPFGGGDPTSDTTSDTGVVTTAAPVASVPETLAFSADATSGYKTMLISLETELGMAGETLTMSGQGAIDGNTTAIQVIFGGAFTTMFQGSGLNRDTLSQPMTLIADGEHSFVKWQVLNDLAGIGDTWVYAPVEAEANPLIDQTIYDPSTFLDMLYVADDDVKEVGTKQLDGQTVTGYAGSFNTDELLPNPDIQNYVDGSGAALNDVQTTVWISDDDLVRQIESDFAIDGLFYRSTVTFSAYGEPVNIDVPSTSDAVPMSSLDSILG